MALLSDDLPFPENLPDSLLASVPGHPLWLEVLLAARSASSNGSKQLPKDLSGALLLKAAVVRYVAFISASSAVVDGGSGAAEGAAAKAAGGEGVGAGVGVGAGGKLPLEKAAARLKRAGDMRQRAGEPVAAIRAPGLCVAPSGAAYPFDWHAEAAAEAAARGNAVMAGLLLRRRRARGQEERAKALACSMGSEGAFDREECKRQLGIRGAAAYSVSYWRRHDARKVARTMERARAALRAGLSEGLSEGWTLGHAAVDWAEERAPRPPREFLWGVAVAAAAAVLLLSVAAACCRCGWRGGGGGGTDGRVTGRSRPATPAGAPKVIEPLKPLKPMKKSSSSSSAPARKVTASSASTPSPPQKQSKRRRARDRVWEDDLVGGSSAELMV